MLGSQKALGTFKNARSSSLIKFELKTEGILISNNVKKMCFSIILLTQKYISKNILLAQAVCITSNYICLPITSKKSIFTQSVRK
jgi:putative flippase GtrA